MDKELLGASIAENRRKQGLTQRELAETLCVTDKAVSKWERGLSYPDITLLEPLAECLGLRVEELLLGTQTGEGDDSTMKKLLAMFRGDLGRQQRRFRRLLAGIVAIVVAVVLVVLYQYAYPECSDWKTTMVLKERIGDTSYFYVEDEGHLLRLRCADTVNFQQITADDCVYAIDCRWNRWTKKGTVTGCEETGLRSSGVGEGMIGAGMWFDAGQKDTRFGYPAALFTYEYIAWGSYRMPESLYSISVSVGNSNDTVAKVLTVENCYSFCQADYDEDGITELAVRTRWPEKPYLIYDLVDGKMMINWPNQVSPNLAERLMTDHERQLQLQKS